MLSTYLVDSLGDAGVGMGSAGDLRYAINQADQDPRNSTILFSPTLDGKTITLTAGMLAINKPSGTLTILGPGDDDLTISGGGQSQVFAILPTSHVSISGLSVTGGIGPDGGGISNSGKLTLTDCTITGNTALGGGGGGIYNGPFGTTTIVASTISGNASELADGSGIDNAGSMTITRSTVSGNNTNVGNGGGIANSGAMAVGDSTISGNSVTGGGGGGIANTSILKLTDDTISDNSADGSGGGVANQAFQGGTITLDNTIVASNVSAQDPRTDDLSDNGDIDGSHLVGGYDLIGSGDLGSLTFTLVGIAPQLGPLRDNGGPTQTQALLPGSPAIKAGDAALVPPGVMTDQRGFPYFRTILGSVNIGAFQVQNPLGFGQRSHLPLPPVAPPAGRVVGLTITPPSPSHSSGPSATGTIAPTAS